MNLRKLTSLPIWQQALLHVVLVWFLFNVYSAIDYGFRVARDGYFIINEDGSPFTEWQRVWHLNTQWRSMIMLLVPFAIELNYHLVFKRKSKTAFVLASLFLTATMVAVSVLANLHNEHLTAIDFLPSFIIILFYTVLYPLARYSIGHQIRQAETKQQHSQAELNTLKAYLNPHFFFNTLNSLYGTALLEKAEKTAKSVEQLSGIMRYVLTEAQHDQTEVASEITFLQDYLQLQKMRLPDRENIKVHTEITYDGVPAQIAPLLLIPFIENAFKYGISLDHDCFVTLNLEVKDKKLDMVLENQLLPERQRDHGAGTGVAHARKRLELLYPGKYQLLLEQQPHYKVCLTLDLR